MLVEGLGFHRARELNAQLAFKEASNQFADVIEGLDEAFKTLFLELQSVLELKGDLFSERREDVGDGFPPVLG